MKLFTSVLLAAFLSLSFAKADLNSSKNLRNGDIIFIQSKSSQSGALEEVTESIWTHMGILIKFPKAGDTSRVVDNSDAGTWYVFEASATDRYTSLNKFVSGTKYSIKRLKENFDFAKAQTLYRENQKLISELDKAHMNFYDIYFTDARRYCSGLVWTIFKRGFNIELSRPEVIGELKAFKGEKIKGKETNLIVEKRFSQVKAPFTFDEWKNKKTVTPVSIYNSDLLVPVAE